MLNLRTTHPPMTVTFKNNKDISARSRCLLIILQAQPVWGNNLLDHTEGSHRWNISGGVASYFPANLLVLETLSSCFASLIEDQL